ncbi:MAG: hypothetical protein JWN48_2650 [Myxococcaceae bacterium]|nr:hypothetical protein [Myxococcaceae bacterium]
MLAAAAERADVAGVVVESGPALTNLTATTGLALYALGSMRPTHARLTHALLTARLLQRGSPLADTLSLWRALTELRRRRLLWIHGERDYIIPRASAALWFRAFGTARWQALSVPKGRHTACVQLGGKPVADAVEAFVAGLLRNDSTL